MLQKYKEDFKRIKKCNSHDKSGHKKSVQKPTFIDWQLIAGWGTDNSNTEVFDFTKIPYTIIVSCSSHLNYPWLNFGNGIFLTWLFCVFNN